MSTAKLKTITFMRITVTYYLSKKWKISSRVIISHLVNLSTVECFLQRLGVLQWWKQGAALAGGECGWGASDG